MKSRTHLFYLLTMMIFLSAKGGAAERLPAEERLSSPRNKSTLAASSENGVAVNLLAIFEAKQLRNRKLRYGDKRTNKIEIEPTARLTVSAFKDRPVSFFSELEFIQKKKRETGSSTTTSDVLDFNQVWLRFDKSLIPDTDLRLGRWLLRDEREWLFDENIDGVYAKFGDKVKTEFAAGRVNYWQRDLLDSSTRGDKTNIMALISRYELSRRWWAGGYAVYQNGQSAENDRQVNIGLRSWTPPRERLSHWLDISTVRGHEDRQSLRGYAADGGVTFRLKKVPLQPHFTLGYAWGSGDRDDNGSISQRYRQTGLQGNEATFGGLSKFKIYGDTFDPELTNIHILTVGSGLNLGKKASFDVVYHYYRQDRLAELVDDTTELKAKYDRKTTKKLGSALDIIVGWRPHQQVKLEGGMAWFAPSSRFYSGSSSHSSRASSASSWWLKAEVKF